MPQDNSKRQAIKIDNADLFPHIINMLNSGHTATITLRGYSMRPFLEDGRDKALLARPQHIAVGDAVLAEVAKGKYVLHRIVSINGNAITLLGDGNFSTEHCTKADIKAIALGFYRKGSTVLTPTNGRLWLAYSSVWTRLYPIRKWLLALYRLKVKLSKPFANPKS